MAGSEIPADLMAKAEQVRDLMWLHNSPRLAAKAVAEALLAERERAARIIEGNQEVVHLKTGRRSLEPRVEGNLAGIAFAAATRQDNPNAPTS